MPYLCLIFNAMVWGLSWWPFRQFHEAGLHPLWTTVALFAASWMVVALGQRSAWREFLRTPALWVVMLAAGTTNTFFNWGVATGDVVRVVLLFYLMPLWAILLARFVLHERLTPLVGVRMVLALAGAAAVLWPEAGGWPWPSSLADVLGLLGGMAFAVNNVMLRREAGRSAGARALAMFSGGVLVSGAAAAAMAVSGIANWPSLPTAWWLLPLALMAVFHFGANLALQYGAARLPANVTAIVMLIEVVAAALSAVAWGGAQLNLPTVLGGMAIIAAALLAALEHRKA